MRIRVLAADDDPHIRALLRLVLEREQYEVIEAADGLDASLLLEKESVHIASSPSGDSATSWRFVTHEIIVCDHCDQLRRHRAA